MKPILFCLFLICTFAASSQEKKDTKIIVSLEDTTDVLNKITKRLYQQDYVVDKKDTENGYISTKEKALKKDASTSVFLKFFVDGNRLIISGEVASNVTLSLGGAKAERTFVPIGFYGMKGSSMKNAWNEMESIAKQFGNKITFSK